MLGMTGDAFDLLSVELGVEFCWGTVGVFVLPLAAQGVELSLQALGKVEFWGDGI